MVARTMGWCVLNSAAEHNVVTVNGDGGYQAGRAPIGAG